MRRSLLPRPAPWAKWSLLPYTFLTAVAAVGLGWWLYGNWVRHPYLLFGLLVCGIAIAHQRWGIRALLIVATTTYFAKRLEFYVYRDNASEFNNPVSLLPEIVLVVLFLSVMLEVWARSGRLSLARSALNLTIVAYFFWALLETANPRSSLVVGLYGFRASALYVLAAFIGQYIFEREQQIYRFMRFSIGLAVIVALYGLWQQISAVPEWDRQWFLNFFSTTQYSWMAGGVFSWEELRKFATLKSPTSAGYFYTIHIAFALTFFLWRRKIIDLLAIAILSAALFFTYVRGAWLSCAVVLLVI
nr:hypothetical protein [Caldilineaceae bacterium]